MSETVVHLEWEFLARKIENFKARLERIRADRLEVEHLRRAPLLTKINDDVSWRLPSDYEVPFTDGAA